MSKTGKSVVGVWFLFMIFAIAFWIAVVWVLVHFISKWW